MLRVDLSRLGREGSVTVDARLPADAELWEGSDLDWIGPVGVRLGVSNAGTGEIVVRGEVGGKLALRCTRCLKPLERSVEYDVTIVYGSAGSENGDDDDVVRSFDPTGDLDLSDAVREEVMLAVNPYEVCDTECRGFCPGCGVDLNKEACACAQPGIDPRWEALRALKEK